MDYVIDWCGFLGAWLLVAGPLNQAAMELQESGDVTRDDLERATQGMTPEPRPSPLWWLVPPVAYVKARQRSRRQREAVMRKLSLDQVRGLVGYIDVGTGWFLVASGAALIAAKETWELIERLELPLWAFFAAYVLMVLASTGYTVSRQRRTHDILERAEEQAADPA